jgi:hypothetical protein
MLSRQRQSSPRAVVPMHPDRRALPSRSSRYTHGKPEILGGGEDVRSHECEDDLSRVGGQPASSPLFDGAAAAVIDS